MYASDKAYFDEWLSKIFVDSQPRESHIHAHNDVVAREAKEREDKIIQEEKPSEEKIMVELNIVKCAIDYLQDSTLMFNLGLKDDTPDPSWTYSPQLFMHHDISYEFIFYFVDTIFYYFGY